MKKLCFILVLAFMFSVSGSMNVNAQPCEGDVCVNALGMEWSDLEIEFQPDDSSCPECWVKIVYKYRDNRLYKNICPNAPEHEFQIDFVVVSGACLYSCNGNPPIYEMGDGEAPYIDALIALMNAYAPPPGNGQCGDPLPNYETTDCKKVIIAPNGNEYIWNCESDDCCVQHLTLCQDGNGNSRLNINSIYTPQADCVPDPDGNDCTSSCMWRQEALVPKIGIDAKDKMIEMSKYNVYLVQANGYSDASISVEGKLDGNLTIYLFDIDGNIILDKVVDVEGDDYYHRFDNNLTIGTYIYSVYHNGLVIKTGKFNIAK